MREGLSQIAAERIFAELCKLLECPAAARGLTALAAAGCVPFVFFESTPDESLFPRLRELAPVAALRMAALLHKSGIETARGLCRRLRAPNAFTDEVCGYLAALAEEPPHDLYTARRFVCRHFHAVEGALALFAVLREQDVTDAVALCRQVTKDRTAVELRRLAINGRELQEATGVAPKDTGKLLARLQDLVWRDPTQNRKNTLLSAAQRILLKEKQDE